MRTFNHISIWFLLTLAWIVPRAVHAQTGDDSADLSDAPFGKVVKEAQSAYSNGEYDRSIRILVRAYSMRSNARLLFNIAKAYQKKGQCGPALVYFRAYINHPGTEKKLMDQAEGQMEGADDCDAYRDELAGRLVVGSTPEGATVKVDGEPRGKTPTEVPMLEPGTHQLELEKEGYETVSFELQMESEKKKEINQILQEKQRATASADDTSSEGEGQTPSDTGNGSGRDSFFWPIHPGALSLAAGGVGGLTVGTVFDLAVIPSTDDERRQVLNNAGPDSDRYQELTDKRGTQVTVALVGYIGGGVLLTSGIVWHVVDATGDNSETASADRAPRWSIRVSPRSVGLDVRFY